MKITNEMMERAIKKMDELLYSKTCNIWTEAHELARYGIVHQILEDAINGAKPQGIQK